MVGYIISIQILIVCNTLMDWTIKSDDFVWSK